MAAMMMQIESEQRFTWSFAGVKACLSHFSCAFQVGNRKKNSSEIRALIVSQDMRFSAPNVVMLRASRGF
jgi:hypothetical protein